MGLLDILNNLQSGPRGQSTPASGSGGMSPMLVAILGLLAQQAIKSFAGGQQGSRPADAGSGGAGANVGIPGGLGDLLKGGMGGLGAVQAPNRFANRRTLPALGARVLAGIPCQSARPTGCNMINDAGVRPIIFSVNCWIETVLGLLIAFSLDF